MRSVIMLGVSYDGFEWHRVNFLYAPVSTPNLFRLICQVIGFNYAMNSSPSPNLASKQGIPATVIHKTCSSNPSLHVQVISITTCITGPFESELRV